MSSDTAFAQGIDGEVDPLYAGFEDTPPADRKVQEDALPRGVYVVEFQAGKASIGKEPDPHLGKPMPAIRLGAKVLNGPAGTVGRVGFGRLPVYPSGNKFVKVEGSDKRVAQKLTAEDYQKTLPAHQGTLRRIQTVLGLVYGLPAKPHTEENLTAWGKQFAEKRAVIDISLLPGNEEFDASNLFIWASIAALDEQVTDKSGKVLGTAFEVALRKIEKADKRAAAKASAGRTAEQFGGSAPSGF